jgi:hypothetical protein
VIKGRRGEFCCIAFDGERELARWQRLLQAQRTRILEGAGHLPKDDLPEEIRAEIRAWWPPT